MFAGKLLGRIAILIVMSTVVIPANAGDWPMWRFDAGRTAASPHALPQDLKLQWVRQLPEQQPAWPASQKKLQFDATYEPIVMGKKVYVGSTVSDSITAYNTETGAEEWRFTTGGPVRFAPVGKGDRIYVVSDDGFLYCLDAGSGALNWKFNGGPSDRTILGNDRLVSSWPARGGPVLVDDVIYFAAGIWPSMGVFIHALDARHGTVNWTNSSTGSQYVVHPHHAPSFGSISPQGYLAASGDSLIVPGGRSIPAVFDRANGELRYFDFGGSFARRRGGYAVSARDGYYFVGGGRLALETGEPLKIGRPQVIAKDMVIEASLGYLDAETLKGTIKEEKKKNRKGEEVVEKKFEVEELWSIELPIDAPEDLFLMAGTDLYTGGEDMVARIDASDEGRVEDDEQEPVWTAEVEGDVGSMIAADDKLFVVTDESKLYCFGTTTDEPITHELEPQQLAEKSDSASEQAASFLTTDGTSE